MICCEVLKREALYAIEHSENEVDVEFLPKGLHDMGAKKMQQQLQTAINAVESGYDYIILGYALCNNGLSNARATLVPLVIPRAHDCITLFLGSRQRYHQYFHANPGTYFHTSGWLEYEDNFEIESQSISHQLGMDQQYEDLVREYGEDNARYLYETLCQVTRNYHKFTFIEMGVEPDERFEQQSREMAAAKNWEFEKIRGDICLFQRLVDGDWQRDFLIVERGECVRPTYDDEIITVVRN